MEEMIDITKWIALAEKSLRELESQDADDRLAAWALIQQSAAHLKAVSETWLSWLMNPQYTESFTVKELSEAQCNFRTATIRLVELTIESMKKHNLEKQTRTPPQTTA